MYQIGQEFVVHAGSGLFTHITLLAIRGDVLVFESTSRAWSDKPFAMNIADFERMKGN